MGGSTYANDNASSIYIGEFEENNYDWQVDFWMLNGSRGWEWVSHFNGKVMINADKTCRIRIDNYIWL